LYAYGAYGTSSDVNFMSSMLPLLDRGVIFAIAHVRGGEEMGCKWYEQGKLLNKMNTFHDFVDCTKYLIKEKYTVPNRLGIMGDSAGGLVIGAVLNQSPELFKVEKHFLNS
jgi:oligopeptidase B